ncbi:MAG TPA: hypothetical protein VJS64_17965, partial [Pyrinomonadaceae bacterium]|nr:hypothetical protein [Pyrinomonadaceae bacterium]
MSLPDLIIRGRRVVLSPSTQAAHTIVPAAIHIRDGRINSIGPYDEVPSESELIETDDESVVMAGLVDSHVHINEPG